MDLDFFEKCFSETKTLSDGNKFFVYSHKNDNIYKCNLCGITETFTESGLMIHNNSMLHKELLKLDVIPYKQWMKGCIVGCTGSYCDPTERFKSMFLDAYDDIVKSDEKFKPKKKELPKCYRKRSTSPDSDHSSEINLSRLVNIKYENVNQKDYSTPSFLSMCRHLTSLEDFLDENLKNGVKDLFRKSIEFERKTIGSSINLLNLESLKFLFTVKDCLFEQLDTIPCKFLKIINLFCNDVLHFTDELAVSCDKYKKTNAMKKKLLQSNETLRN